MKKSSDKSFGILFFIVFLLIAIWPLFGDGSIRYWSLVVAFIFFAIALLKQELLKPLNIAWIKFGEILGKVIAPIVMALVFFLIFGFPFMANYGVFIGLNYFEKRKVPGPTLFWGFLFFGFFDFLFF